MDYLYLVRQPSNYTNSRLNSHIAENLELVHSPNSHVTTLLTNNYKQKGSKVKVFYLRECAGHILLS